jgi:hypothetical protein
MSGAASFAKGRSTEAVACCSQDLPIATRSSATLCGRSSPSIVTGAATRLERGEATRLWGKEGEQLAASELATGHRPPRRIRTMRIKNALGEIEAPRNLCHCAFLGNVRHLRQCPSMHPGVSTPSPLPPLRGYVSCVRFERYASLAYAACVEQDSSQAYRSSTMAHR